MSTRVARMAIIGSLMYAGVMHAQDAPTARSAPLAASYMDPIGGLDLTRAIAQAIEREPSLRAARTEEDVARGMRVQAGLRPNPVFSFLQQREPAGTDSQTRVDMVWPLDLFRKTGRVSVADEAITTARHVVADRERLLAAEVRSAYGAVAAAVRELAILDDLFDAVSSQRALVTARVEQGAAPPVERDVLRVEAGRLRADRLRQSGATDLALIALKRVIGMPIDAPLRLKETMEQLVQRDAAAPPSLGVQTIDTRPDVEAAASRVLAADADVARARGDGRFDVSLFGMYMRMDAGFPQRGFAAGGGLEPVRGLFHYVAAGASVTVPLRDRKQGEVAVAQARRIGAAAELDAMRLSAQAELAAARVRDARAREAVAIFATETRDLAKQTLSVVQQTYQLGRATVFDVLAEQRRYLEVERAYTGALRDAYEARQALRRALGELR